MDDGLVPRDASNEESVYRMLGLCARVASSPEQLSALAERAKRVDDWSRVPEIAEEQGVAPLVHTYLVEANAHVPEQVQRQLAALKLRHRRADKIRTSALLEIHAALRDAGVEMMVLKGAALSHWVYPDPGLRPRRDIDILVREHEVTSAIEAIEKLGFGQHDPQEKPSRHHTPTLAKTSDGLLVSVEVHFALGLLCLRNYRPLQRQRFEDLRPTAFELNVNGTTVLTLGKSDMLRHVYRHAFAGSIKDRMCQLAAVADIVGMLQAWEDEIDSTMLRNADPDLFAAIAAIDAVTPLTTSLRQKLGLKKSKTYRTVLRTYYGWQLYGRPHHPSTFNYVVATLFPSPWWLALRHGGGRGVWRALRALWRHLVELLFHARHPEALKNYDQPGWLES